MGVILQEAALLLREGEDNEKFSSQPKGRMSVLAYRIVHYPVIYWIIFLTAVGLMALAIFELPSASHESEKFVSFIVKGSLALFNGHVTL